MSSNVGIPSMITECAFSETEDGELIDDPSESPVEIQNKLEIRAKRFGIASAKITHHSNKKLQELYNSLGVNLETRLESLHMFGVGNMKTQDIFAYFEPDCPASVEWITDDTCNAVWLDESTCAQALLASSVPIKKKNEDVNSMESCDSMDYIREEDLRLALPPGSWRKGHSKQFAPNVFLRFATRHDKKSKVEKILQSSAELTTSRDILFPDQGDEQLQKIRPDSVNPWADIARQWGHFEKNISGQVKRDRIDVMHKKIPLRDARDLINKKEFHVSQWDAREILSSEKPLASENRDVNDRRFGKMHADIEEMKLMDKCLKRRRSHEETDLRQRLGSKRSKTLIDGSSGSSSEEENFKDPENGKSIKERLGESTWISYESDDGSNPETDVDDESQGPDLRQKLTRSSKPFVPRSPLRIEIDNDIYYSGNHTECSDSL